MPGHSQFIVPYSLCSHSFSALFPIGSAPHRSVSSLARIAPVARLVQALSSPIGLHCPTGPLALVRAGRSHTPGSLGCGPPLKRAYSLVSRCVTPLLALALFRTYSILSNNVPTITTVQRCKP